MFRFPSAVRPAASAPWRRALFLALAALVASCGLFAAGADSADEVQRKLEATRARITALAQERQATETRRGGIGKALLEQAKRLDRAATELRTTEERLQAVAEELAELEHRRDAVQASLEAQREALADLLRAAYQLGHGSDLRMLLGQVRRCTGEGEDTACAPGDDAMASLQRALAYSRYFQADRQRRIRALLEQLELRRQLEADVTAQRAALLAQREQQEARRETLLAERGEQERLLAEAEAQIRSQGGRLQELQREQTALQRLLEDLTDILADIPAELPDQAPFASRRGKLPWPVAGEAAERKDGIRIAVAAGSEVHAVAHGRVAYADWLRGYGLLLIIEHGDGWMSLYGDNESLLRGVGDWVGSGEPVAVSGRGEEGAPGLFFALRHKGKPVAPLPWLAPR